jgi:DNA primase
MVDTTHLKTRVDCRQLVEADLGQPPRRGSRAWNWRCPFHHERKGFSLAVWVDGWRCFGACQTGGDAIDWLQRYRGLDFAAACRELDAPETGCPAQPRHNLAPPVLRPEPPLTIAQPPPDEWQQAARKIVDEAERTLWQPEGERALAYLRHKRGLFCTTIRQARLGYIPGEYRQWRRLHGLNVPCGITIPWFTNGSLWALKVRRAAGLVRYEQVGSGNQAGCLYWADNLLPGWPALLVEGEFNCLVAWQEAMDLVCPVSLGSASASLNPRWHAALATSPLILACYDQDDAGEKASTRLHDLTARVRFVHVPEGKDLNAYCLLHREEPRTVYQWLVRSLTVRKP